jgi:RNA polymerase primary sigma factor
MIRKPAGVPMAAKDNDDQKPEAEENEHTLDMSQAAVKKTS